MDEFPKMIFRDGTETQIWGHDVDTRIVGDSAEEKEALADGWRLTPDKHPQLDHDGDGKSGGSRKRAKLTVKTEGDDGISG